MINSRKNDVEFPPHTGVFLFDLGFSKDERGGDLTLCRISRGEALLCMEFFPDPTPVWFSIIGTSSPGLQLSYSVPAS